MTPVTANLTLQECVNLYITEDTPEPLLESNFVVGPNPTSRTVMIRNGHTLLLKDIFIFSAFSFRAVNLDPTSPKPSLFARNIYLVGHLMFFHVHANYLRAHVISDGEAFRKEVLGRMRSLMKDEKQ